ncbi:MAG: hypothetical protein ACP5OB_08675 [Candidatus Ratteibacteria bacterium]
MSITSLRTGNFCGIYGFLYCAFSAFNLFSLFKEKVLAGTGLENLGLTEITDKLMDIPGKIEQQNQITKIFLLYTITTAKPLWKAVLPISWILLKNSLNSFPEKKLDKINKY